MIGTEATVEGRIVVSIEGSVARLVIDNAARRNALTAAMMAELAAQIRRLDDDPDVRVIAVRGAGDKAFASGVDVGALEGAAADRDAVDRLYVDLCLAVQQCTTPVVAAIQGACAGGGLSLALEADLRIGADNSWFSIPATRIGLGYADAGSLVRAVGHGTAADMLLTGRRIAADEAARVGLLHRLHPSADFADAVERLLTEIGTGAPLALRAAKAALRAERAESTDADAELLRNLVERCRASADLSEGIQAFREHRPPMFTGR